jgi:c-di-GMP-binding flagellar brake protein YcgR
MRERRRSTRTQTTLKFKLGYEGFDCTAETLNVSANGCLCRATKSIPLMTKVAVQLLLPKNADDADSKPVHIVRAEGAVVRSDSMKESGLYVLAIYFTDINKEAKSRLEEFVYQSGGGAKLL